MTKMFVNNITDGPLPSTLQEVTVPVIRNDICEAMYRNAGYIEHIPHIFICAGHKLGAKDSCEGDSGGLQQTFMHLKFHSLKLHIQFCCCQFRSNGHSERR